MECSNASTSVVERTIDLSTLPFAWDTIVVRWRVSVEGMEEVLKRCVPRGSAADVMAVILCLCEPTRWRSASGIAWASDAVESKVEIERTNVHGEVELAPAIALKQRRSSPQSGYAYSAGAVVATGSPLLLRLDAADVGPGGGVDIKWEEFVGNYTEALYRVVSDDGSSPKIYINNKYGVLKPIVDNADRGRTARTVLRDAIFGLMAPDIWMQLVEFALQSATADEDQVETNGEKPMWNRVFESVGKQSGLGTAEQIRQMLLEDGGESDSRPRMRAALQHSIALARRQANLVEAIGESSPNGGE
jgi:hypothetical protein